MYRLPAESAATANGSESDALIAGPPSPAKVAVPLPAIVVIVPPETLRMRLLEESAMYRLPAESIATPSGTFSAALVADPPSPENPAVPLPATVVILPPDTFKTRLLRLSAIYKLPAESAATP